MFVSFGLSSQRSQSHQDEQIKALRPLKPLNRWVRFLNQFVILLRSFRPWYDYDSSDRLNIQYLSTLRSCKPITGLECYTLTKETPKKLA